MRVRGLLQSKRTIYTYWLVLRRRTSLALEILPVLCLQSCPHSMRSCVVPCFCYLCLKVRVAECTSQLPHTWCLYRHAWAGLNFHGSCTSSLWSHAPLFTFIMTYPIYFNTYIHTHIYIYIYFFYFIQNSVTVRYSLFFGKWNKWWE